MGTAVPNPPCWPATAKGNLVCGALAFRAITPFCWCNCTAKKMANCCWNCSAPTPIGGGAICKLIWSFSTSKNQIMAKRCKGLSTTSSTAPTAKAGSIGGAACLSCAKTKWGWPTASCSKRRHGWCWMVRGARWANSWGTCSTSPRRCQPLWPRAAKGREKGTRNRRSGWLGRRIGNLTTVSAGLARMARSTKSICGRKRAHPPHGLTWWPTKKSASSHPRRAAGLHGQSTVAKIA